MEAIALVGVASLGATEQWDGMRTPTGVLRRWALPPGMPFPDLGFDIYRAQLPDRSPLLFHEQVRDAMLGRREYDYDTPDDGTVAVLRQSRSFEFDPPPNTGNDWSLAIRSSDPIEIAFPLALHALICNYRFGPTTGARPI